MSEYTGDLSPEREEIRRAFNIWVGRTRGIRLVPPDPHPSAFKPATYACDERPKRCAECHPSARASRCEESTR